MKYVMAYEECALLFILLLGAKYFEVRRFPNQQNKLFATILFCAIIDIALDIISSVLIQNVATAPVWINYSVNSVFYAIQIALPAFMAAYIAVLADKWTRNRPLKLMIALPCLAFESTLIINLFNGMVFSVAPINGVMTYIRGPFFRALYVGTAIYFVMGVTFALCWREAIGRKRTSGILFFIFVLAAATVAQAFQPEYLLTGVGMALAMYLMFFTMQNPEEMLDHSSGVFNYDAALQYLAILHRNKRELRLIAIDINGVRRINAAYGLAVGNDTFESVGRFLLGLRGIEAFRTVGPRFLLLAKNGHDYMTAIYDVSRRFASPWMVKNEGGKLIEVDLSADIRYFNSNEAFLTPVEVMDLVEAAYEGEGGHLTRCVPLDTALLSHYQRQQAVETALRRALLRDGEGFELHFQPIYGIADACYPTAEALLRFDCESLGRVSPGEFIPIAERAGLIIQIDELVLRRACEFLLSDAGRRCGFKYVEINLSAAEFFTNPYRRISAIVNEYGAKPSSLCFEITETAASQHPRALTDFMASMLEDGFRFAMDDFGTGYANIAQVMTLPFSIVKLDREMLTGGEKHTALLAGLTHTFKGLGLELVAEGVETEEQMRRISEMGVDYIQGYFFARPMPAAQTAAFIGAHR